MTRKPNLNLLRPNRNLCEYPPIDLLQEELPLSSRSRHHPSIKDEEAQLDQDIHALLRKSSVASTSTRSYDSIMGPDSEGEEEEVSDLLGKE